jgi:SAM-dependent methyltransferase
MNVLGPHGRTRTWLRHQKVSLFTWAGRSIARDVIAGYLTAHRELHAQLQEFQSRAPQGQIADDTITHYDLRDWRRHFSGRLQGRGLELGPLNRPLPRHEGMSVTYVDYADQATLHRQYPALAQHIGPVDVIDDAETLATIPDGGADFLISAHVIEHMRDPIGAIRHWLRVLRPGGLLYLIVPDKRRTTDQMRVRTTLEHMVLDHEQPSAERDFEHYLDYAVFVHHARTDDAIGEARRLRDTGSSVHFHVFLPQDVLRLLAWIDGHVARVSVVEGPAMSPETDEFHLLLRKGGP